ncbi:DsbA family protein [Arthrobacter ginkgonis]|uniref:DsbA family protein n=1 Tax=Arthrobacter ginkgonis TaxID=1630594 RepID=A0ABP7DHP1_9MICC
MPRVRLTYAFDAYCGWCYGCGPALHRFTTANASRIELQVMSGGLFSGATAGPTGAYPHIPAANERITGLTGVIFGEPYQRVLAEGTMMMDSAAAAAGLVALRRQAPERALEFAAAIQSAWYLQGRDLRDPALYREIAAAHGIDADEVSEVYATPAVRAEAEEDFRRLRRLGVSQYPALLLHTATGVHRLGGPVSNAEALTAALDAHLLPSTP